jgi:tetratricopeptide (TPR) repeat protein
VLEQQQRSHNLFGYTGIAQNYALSGDEAQSRHYLEAAYTLFEEEPRPRRKWWCLYEIADGYRMLKEYDTAKTACQKSMEWFLNTAENAEDLIYLAGARLVMGKILVETEEHQEALSYLNKAKTAFETCRHYALGEAWFYLGKAYQGIGDHQAREYIKRALAEFQRLKLQHKASKAQELLEMFS